MAREKRGKFLSNTMSFLSVVILLIAPAASRRLVVPPPPTDTEWDSVIVSSDPIKITEGKKIENKNEALAGRQPDYSIRLNQNNVDGAESRMGKSCKYNDISCLYGTEAPKVDTEKSDDKNQEIIDRFLEQYSAITDVRFNTNPNDNRTSPEVKAYWNKPSSNHPFDDKKGWVTLETVPWSTSMVSKWQPNVQPTHPSPSNFDRLPDKPWNYGGMSDRPTAARPTPALQTWTNNRPPPVTTNYGSYTPVSNHHESHFESSGSTSGYREPPRPAQLESVRPISHWGVGNNDIITDNRPTNFPVGNSGGSLGGGGYQSFQFMNPGSTQNGFQSNYFEDQHTMNTQPAPRPTKYPSVNHHPSTYPEAGNGEWILLSTTKGYSLSNGYRPGKTMSDSQGKRAELSRYHEEDIEEHRMARADRKSDEGDIEIAEDDMAAKGLRVLHSENGSKIFAAAKRRGKEDWKMEESPLHVLYTSADEKKPEAMTLRRAVRLQVLPPESSSTTYSHGGLLEVDSNQETVDEAQKAMEDEKVKQLSKIANVRRSNYTLYKVVPTDTSGPTGKSMSDKGAAMLAAVGAGMIPATMAVLVPMALGRKKREVAEDEPELPFLR